MTYPTASHATNPMMRIAVATKGSGIVNQHFGHAKEFLIYEVDANSVQWIERRQVENYCQGGYGEATTIDDIINTIADCEAVLVSKIGFGPQEKLKNAGLEVVQAYDVIETVARAFYDSRLITSYQGAQS